MTSVRTSRFRLPTALSALSPLEDGLPLVTAGPAMEEDEGGFARVDILVARALGFSVSFATVVRVVRRVRRTYEKVKILWSGNEVNTTHWWIERRHSIAVVLSSPERGCRDILRRTGTKGVTVEEEPGSAWASPTHWNQHVMDQTQPHTNAFLSHGRSSSS